MNHAATVRSLQQRITEMQPLRMGDDVLPTPDPLRPLLPAGALRKGAATAVQGSQQLALSLLSDVSTSGAWCGAIGFSAFGFEAAAQLGLALDRFVLVPRPGKHALGIAGMLSEVFSALVLQLPHQPSPGEVERLAARLREHGTALVVTGPWPRCDASLRVTETQWSGLGSGHGLLEVQDLTVQSLDRRGQRSHRVRFSSGRLAAAPAAPRLRVVPS